MEYKHVNGPVYCRYAFTPPVVNSELAERYGIEAPTVVPLQVGSNVKIRMILEQGKLRMTCHAKIDWVKEDKAGEVFSVGLSHLSLTDQEFKVLAKNLVDAVTRPLEFGPTVRDKGLNSEPITKGEQEEELQRVKAVTMPVSLIEAIDSKRGPLGFSEFVCKAIWDAVRD